MPAAPIFQEDLINRYDKPGPRYTSYPPATEFHDRIDEGDYRSWARQSNEEPIPKPLSLYFHIPFCSSICYYCACNKIVTREPGTSRRASICKTKSYVRIRQTGQYTSVCERCQFGRLALSARARRCRQAGEGVRLCPATGHRRRADRP